MTVKRYNYLPHPISEYGPFRSQPNDTSIDLLARKDQATWNFTYLACGAMLDKWHNLLALPSNAAAGTVASLLYMNYRAINALLDGVQVRHQVLHLPPNDFALWFAATGGYEMLEGYGQGFPRISSESLATFDQSLLSKSKSVHATEIE